MVPTPSLPMEISLRFGRSAESTSGSILPVVTPRGGNYQSSARSPTLPLFSSRQLRRQSWFPPVESPKCGDWMVPQLLPAPTAAHHLLYFLTVAPISQLGIRRAVQSLSLAPIRKLLPTSLTQAWRYLCWASPVTFFWC